MTKKGLLSSVPPAGPGLEVLVESQKEQAGPVKQASRKKQLGKKIRSSPAAFLELIHFFLWKKGYYNMFFP